MCDYMAGRFLTKWKVVKSGSSSNGIVNGKTPASRFADKLRGLSNSKRPNTVVVIRTAVRKASDMSGVHGTYKAPCDVCQPLLDFFGIEDIR